MIGEIILRGEKNVEENIYGVQRNEKMKLKVTGVYPVAKWKWETGDMDSCLICSLGFGMACPSCSVGGDLCPLGLYSLIFQVI